MVGYPGGMNQNPSRDTVLEVDDRRRVTLGRLGSREHVRYLASEDPDGTITLRPAVVMTELEARMLANQDVVRRIQTNRENPSRLVRRPRQNR
jgi:hypothetical protein